MEAASCGLMIKWSDALTEFVGFIATFFAAGAIGFRLAIINRVIEERAFHRASAVRAAIIGLIGSAVLAWFYFSGGRLTAIATVLNIAAIVGFILVLARLDFGWWISAVGVIFAPLTPLLFFVLGVVALGAWNWRRQRPLLCTEGAAVAIRRSATAELSVAMIVLVVTAILVSLPAPK